jgi:hypothetical protein
LVRVFKLNIVIKPVINSCLKSSILKEKQMKYSISHTFIAKKSSFFWLLAYFFGLFNNRPTTFLVPMFLSTTAVYCVDLYTLWEDNLGLIFTERGREAKGIRAP